MLKLRMNLWGEAIITACHIHNRIPFKKLHVSPYDIRKERKPNTEYFKVWGCWAFYNF